MRTAVGFVLCAACSFSAHTNAAHDGALGDDDAPLDTGDNGPPPLHLSPGDGNAGTGGLVLSGSVMIDTSAPSISVTLPDGDSFDVRPQAGGGPDLAVLHVGALTVSNGADVKVTGSRPLVIVAGDMVEIDGAIDASGHNITPGPGGFASGMGSGAGGAGSHETSDDSDSGGGGGGYGTAGAAGGGITGACTVAGGTAGAVCGDAAITTLVGGSGGASSSGTACPPDPGGGGGGALQITSAVGIAISGAINVGGGGGHGATDCGQSDVNSGAGGGAGGSLVLQAAAIMNTGVLAANGGGGGGSSSTSSGNAMPGQDAHASTAVATGGTGPRAMGGSGGTGTTAPTSGGGTICGNNAGGGGGAVGRIAASTSYGGAGIASPAPDTSLPI